jgi:hypothetical protein
MKTIVENVLSNYELFCELNKTGEAFIEACVLE